MLEHKLQHHVQLAPLTTLRLGGTATRFLSCYTLADIIEGVRYANAHRLPWFVLGGGSNLIVPDTSFPGLVLHIQLLGIQIRCEGNDCLLTVQAGEPWDDFVQFCVNHGLAGLECLSGIPGSVGATPKQNVGAYGQEVRHCIETVTALDTYTSETVTFRNEECLFGYRDSRFKTLEPQRFIITSVQFRLPKQGEPQIRYAQLHDHLAENSLYQTSTTLHQRLQIIRDTVIAIRHSKSMVVRVDDPNSRSAGSFFTNPIVDEQRFAILQAQFATLDIPHFPTAQGIKISAAWLIEQAGFYKGYRYQNVGISDNHALALVNHAGTTTQLLALAEHIQRQVAAKFNIVLAREPVVMK
jgi:UDP-N-acetylmuramate dehydrogenase